MDQTLLRILLEQTFTKRSLIRRLRFIKDFISFRLFDLPQDQREALSLKDQIEQYLSTNESNLLVTENLAQDQAWLQSLGESFFKNFTPDALNTSFKSLSDQLNSIEPVVIYLAIQLPEREENLIGEWFKKNLGYNALVEIRYDASLIGGCAISYRGVYKDFSIRDRLNQNKQPIIESLKSFKHA